MGRFKGHHPITLQRSEFRIIMRKRLGLTQKEAARLCGFSSRFVAYLESGQRNSKNYDRKLEKLYEQYRKQSAQRRAA